MQRFLYTFTLAVLLLPAGHALGQAQPAVTTEPVTLTLDEAVQIALVNNYALRTNRLDVADAEAQVREAVGTVLPQVDLSYSYTRNVKSANPFAGSEAGGLFASFGFIDWLSFNERARTDDDPSTDPISFDEFADRQSQGLEDAGVTVGGSDNPFNVPNQFQGGISVSQTLFDRAKFISIRGANELKDINRLGVDRQEQLLVDDVREAFYAALLAQEQADVVGQSVLRTRESVEEVGRRVAQGTAPKYQRLSAEVELANLETELVQVQNAAALALDNLKLALAIPVRQPVRLRGALEADPSAYRRVALDDALASALDRRPDVAQARLAIELREIDRKRTAADNFPTLSAFANFNYIGQVPDDRSSVFAPDATDPFTFETETNRFFSSNYWSPSVNVGLRVSWNVFNGFQTRARVQQRQIAVERARLDFARLRDAVALEVEAALRDLETAAQRIQSQQLNVDRAELNYEYADARVREGVATQLELREASDQLDQSRLNYAQAVYDFLVARSAFETAVGMPTAGTGDLNLTSN